MRGSCARCLFDFYFYPFQNGLDRKILFNVCEYDNCDKKK